MRMSFNLFAHNLQGVEQRGAGDNGRAVLVVVHHRDVHLFFQSSLHLEALRRFDILQVDAPESGLQRLHDLHEFFYAAGIYLQVEDVDARKLFEQYAFSLHHGLGGFRANVAQAKHRCSVRNHAHQVAFGSIFIHIFYVGGDLPAGLGYSG